MAAKQFANKVVIITGAAGGIGTKIVEHFVKEGALVAIGDKNFDKLQNVQKVCATKGGCEPLALACDVTKDEDLKKLVDNTIKTHNKLDILINNAGIIHFDSTESTNIDTFQKIFRNNIRSIVNMGIYAVPHLLKSKGNMVCVSSVAGIRGFPNLLSYCVSNSAMDQYVRCSSLDLAPKGVRVNGVNPGAVTTDLYANAGLASKDVKEFYSRAAKTHPLGRPGTPEEVVSLISFLASPRAGWITGACFSVDGGWQLNCPI